MKNIICIGEIRENMFDISFVRILLKVCIENGNSINKRLNWQTNNNTYGYVRHQRYPSSRWGNFVTYCTLTINTRTFAPMILFLFISINQETKNIH